MNAMTEYYYAKEREESAVERINDSYLEALNSLEKLEAENAKLREYAKLMHDHIKECCDACGERGICDVDALTRSLEIEVDG